MEGNNDLLKLKQKLNECCYEPNTKEYLSDIIPEIMNYPKKTRDAQYYTKILDENEIIIINYPMSIFLLFKKYNIPIEIIFVKNFPNEPPQFFIKKMKNVGLNTNCECVDPVTFRIMTPTLLSWDQYSNIMNVMYEIFNSFSQVFPIFDKKNKENTVEINQDLDKQNNNSSIILNLSSINNEYQQPDNNYNNNNNNNMNNQQIGIYGSNNLQFNIFPNNFQNSINNNNQQLINQSNMINNNQQLINLSNMFNNNQQFINQSYMINNNNQQINNFSNMINNNLQFNNFSIGMSNINNQQMNNFPNLMYNNNQQINNFSNGFNNNNLVFNNFNNMMNNNMNNSQQFNNFANGILNNNSLMNLSLNNNIGAMPQFNEIKDDSNKDNEKVSIDKIIAVIFTSTDQSINFPIAGLKSDLFSKLEEKLYLEYPDLRNKNIFFIAKGNIVKKNLNLEENNIKNGDHILINFA